MRTLTAYRQSLAMPQATVAAKIHEALDVHRHVAAQIAFDFVMFVDVLADFENFGLGALVDALGRRNPGALANLKRVGRPDAKDITQRNMQRLLRRNIHTCNTGHKVLLLFYRVATAISMHLRFHRLASKAKRPLRHLAIKVPLTNRKRDAKKRPIPHSGSRGGVI